MPEFIDIQKGLRYSIFTSSKLGEDFVRVEKKKDKIVFRYQYSGVECVLIDPSNPIATHIVIESDPAYLKAIDQELTQRIQAISRADLCCVTQVHLHEILKSKSRGLEQKVFLQSKFLQLVLSNIEQEIIEKADCGACKFLNKPFEKEKIVKTRDIILSSLNESLTIPNLAQRVGMNECYLKKGFKELFGKTIFAYVQEARMKRAKMLLNTEELSVSEIAYEVGYSNLSGFSAAFKKQVGVFPSEFVVQ